MVDYERAYYQYEAIFECSGYTHSDYLMRAIPEKVYQKDFIIYFELLYYAIRLAVIDRLGGQFDEKRIQEWERFKQEIARLTTGV